MSHVHIVGAGLAGLACATALAARGISVILHEAAGQAGGRCRSYHDPRLDRLIDNGNHLIVGANPETFRYLDRLGARDRLRAVRPAALAFHDLSDGQSWTLRPGSGPLPLWLLDPERRVPSTTPAAYLGVLRLAIAGAAATVADILDLTTPLGRRLWHPLTVSILNTRPEEASARLLWNVLRRTLLRGEAACRPHVARHGLTDSLVTPALALLERRGAEIRWKQRLRALSFQDDRVKTLHFEHQDIAIGTADQVVLATPPAGTAELLPGHFPPPEHRAILNAHFRLPCPIGLPGSLPLLGLVGGMAEWVFVRGDVLSVTVSAADVWMDQDAPVLMARLWTDVAQALGLEFEPLCGRIVKERRATPAATPDWHRKRPASRTSFRNLLLAGDWTDTGLPATIEGAILSGHRAAALCHQGRS